MYREEIFLDQVPEHQDIYYHDNGAVAEVYTYIKNQRVGPHTAYFENGKKKTKGYYLYDHPAGKWKHYDPSGTLKEVTTHEGRP